MRTSTSSRLVMLASLVVGWGYLTAADCAPDAGTGPQPTFQECPVAYSSNWPGARSPVPNDFSVDKPAHCPFAAGGYPKTDFAAVAHLSAYDFQSGYSTQTWTTWNGNGVVQFVEPHWSTGTQFDYFVNYSGYYYAGGSGCQGFTNKGYDLMQANFKSADGADLYAVDSLKYTCDFPQLNLTTPYNSEIQPYSDYTVSVTINDIGMTGAITYQWYVDDQLVATTSSPQATFTAGPAFSSQNLHAVASDGYGRSEVGDRTITIGSGCADNQINC